MKILVLNCGSSSLKFQLIETDQKRIDQNQDEILCKGIVERIGSQCLIDIRSGDGSILKKTAKPIKSHAEAIRYVIEQMEGAGFQQSGIEKSGSIDAVGHRVVHGGAFFSESVIIDQKVIDKIEECIELAPLHNPANLKGIRACLEILGKKIPQIAVFDTSFHSTMPEASYLYPIPYSYYRRYKIRRYGFHGTSHRYISYRYRSLKNLKKKDVNIVTLHLGNGCSICAIKNGKSFLTSMGMTPLEGLMMGTRSGNVDPGLLDYMANKEGLTPDNLDTILNKHSGLLGISGITNDMRELLAEVSESKDRRARLAIDMFCQRIKGFLGYYQAVLGGADAICFAGGIGENSHEIRSESLKGLEFMGVKLDSKKNKKKDDQERLISADDSKQEVWVIPTNEELLIARDTLRKMN